MSPAPHLVRIQRMPVTKVIERVTIGDLSRGAACTSNPRVRLWVVEYAEGDFGDPDELSSSAVNPELGPEPAKVSWVIPPTTLRADRAYAFRVAYVGAPTGCSQMNQTTWAHNEAQVEGGPAVCNSGSPLGTASSPHFRFWHVSGESDLPAGSYCASANFEASMPTGWLARRPGGGLRTASRIPQYDGQQQYHACQASTGQFNPYLYGATELYWRPVPNSSMHSWVCRWPQYAAPGDRPPHGWYYAVPWRSERNGAPRDMYLKLETIDYDALIERYRPQLRYHFAEAYRADSAWIATLPLPPFPGDPDRSNNLERENGAILAAADPLLGYPPLSLDGLPARDAPGGDLYPSGEPALDSDRLDFRNETYQDDAAAMHANSGLANRIYARATQDAEGKLWLQYWFFYYYNDVIGFGAHEADWEMIQVGLNSALTPDVATYAQHSGAQSCTWDRVPKYAGPSGTAPVVFVRIGAHASEFYPSLVESYAAESGSERVRPVIETQMGNLGPGWANWRGRWGGSDAVIRSPAEQGTKWDNPTGFNTAAGPCPVEASGIVTARHSTLARRGGRLNRSMPAPSLAVKRLRSRVLVRYRYTRHQWKRLPRKAGLILAVRSGRTNLPRNLIFRLRHRAGRRRFALPTRTGAYLVQGQTVAQSGSQGRPVTLRFR
jgi:hypothetical protein